LKKQTKLTVFYAFHRIKRFQLWLQAKGLPECDSIGVESVGNGDPKLCLMRLVELYARAAT